MSIRIRTEFECIYSIILKMSDQIRWNIKTPSINFLKGFIIKLSIFFIRHSIFFNQKVYLKKTLVFNIYF